MSSEFLPGHHLRGSGFKMISTSWALLGKENLWDWICKRREGVSQLPSSHGEDTCSRALLLLARGSALPREGYCFLSLKPFLGQQWGGSLASGTTHRWLQMGYQLSTQLLWYCQLPDTWNPDGKWDFGYVYFGRHLRSNRKLSLGAGSAVRSGDISWSKLTI